jgi:hypothetical protein
MPHIQVSDAQSWLEKTKTNLGPALDDNLEASIASQVLARVVQSYDVSTWTDNTSTPRLVRDVIAMKYASWFYNRQYSEDDQTNEYALLLNAQAEVLIDGIIDGSIDLPEIEGPGPGLENLGPSYEKSDPVFTMGKVF